MGVALFCEHKRLRTGCPQCKPSALPPPTSGATPYVSSDERLEREEKRAARAAAPKEERERAPREAKEMKPRGPGKPIMPVRQKKKGISADEAASATAWWVKK